MVSQESAVVCLDRWQLNIDIKFPSIVSAAWFPPYLVYADTTDKLKLFKLGDSKMNLVGGIPLERPCSFITVNPEQEYFLSINELGHSNAFIIDTEDDQNDLVEVGEDEIHLAGLIVT